MFNVAILRDILKEQMPDRLPNGLLGSIVECHVRGMLPERLSAEYHDDNDNEIDYVNTVRFQYFVKSIMHIRKRIV